MGERAQVPFGDPWYVQVPDVHRWLNGNRSEPFPRTYPHERLQVELWLPPYYLMKAILGWQDCAAGVAYLLENRDSLGGPAKVLLEVWGEEVLGSLGWWEWNRLTAVGKTHRSDHVFRRLSLHERFEPDARRNAFDGSGTDPKHLASHLAVCTEPYQLGRAHPVLSEHTRAEAEIIRTEDPRRVALFVADFEDWPGELGRLAAQLTPAPPSWHVHVVARTPGYIGRFRRCWTCGRWFQGRATPHAWGHRSGA